MKIQKNLTLVKAINTMQLRIGNSGYATLTTDRWKTENLAVPYNRLYVIESGNGLLSSGKQELAIEPGKAYLLPAGLPCSYRCDKTITKMFIDFNLFQLNRFDQFNGFPQIAVIDVTPEILSDLKTHYFSKTAADALWIQNCIFQLMYAFHEKYNFASNTLNSYSAHVASTIDYIQEHLSARLRIDELAERCFVSKSYLTEHFRKETGIPVGRYIDQQLINVAQWQLSQTDTSIEKISSALGFCNQFYFSKCFKKHCNVSPQEYRKRLQHRQ